MERKRIERISTLTAISRERELTEAEKKEREELRAEYIQSIKSSLRAELKKVEIVD